MPRSRGYCVLFIFFCPPAESNKLLLSQLHSFIQLAYRFKRHHLSFLCGYACAGDTALNGASSSLDLRCLT